MSDDGLYDSELSQRNYMQMRLALVTGALALVTATATAERTRDGLLALYDFSGKDPSVVEDRSGVSPPLDLRIADAKAVQRSGGVLHLTSPTLIASEKPAAKIIDAVGKSGEVTVEAWIRSSDANQSGPARIVSLSQHSTARNFTVGQDGNKIDVRFRTTTTSENGLPSLASKSGSLGTDLSHIAYTRSRDGKTTTYLNGRPAANTTISGAPTNWDKNCRLALGNELTNDRPWRGSYHLVAIYGRALNAKEIIAHSNAGAGPGAKSVPKIAVTNEPAPKKPDPPEQKPTAPSPPSTSSDARTATGIIAFYDFRSASGSIVKDRSGSRQPIDLRISKPASVRRSEGALEVRGDTIIQSERPATKLIEAVRKSGEMTIEAWVRPANTKQEGPARIVTLSKSGSERNFTLGQEGDKYDARFRTTRTSTNGIPSTDSGSRSLAPKLTHIVYTRSRNGRARLYLNGKQRAEKNVKGSTSNWDKGHRLALANEFSGDRQWLGTYHLVAIYNRDLSPNRIAQHYGAGVDGFPGFVAEKAADPNEHLFESKIAPILAKHCVECHDSATAKGDLDLSKKAKALAGGSEGKPLVPGSAEKSLLWEVVATDDMPKKRPPLSIEEKKLLKQWIDGGAKWSKETIDPADYIHDSHSGGIFVQRLTVPEYIETVRTVTGVDISKEAREILPRDLRADGFSNTAYNLNVDLSHVDAYAKLAEIIVSRMDTGKFAARFSRSRKFTDNDMGKLIEKMGEWVLRGPVDDREVIAYRGISTTVASSGGKFEEAVGFILEAMLQSPRFIYRIENQVGDGTPWQVGDYELASRMSYILWGGPPDQQLLQAAERGDFSGQIDRMLQDPRAVARSKQFVSEWLNLGRLANMSPSKKRFPNWDPAIAADMREETLAFWEEIVWKQKRPLADLFNAQVSFMTPRLAKHYGLSPSGKGLERRDLAQVSSRGGLLTHGSVLTIGGDDGSTVTRGLFVLHDVLRGVVKDPPPGTDTTPIPSKPGWSHRRIAEQRIGDRSCGGCHKKFEPLAFGFGKFDGLGSYREKDEHDNVLREDGTILFPGSDGPKAFKTAAELMDLIAGSDRVKQTVTWKVTQFALGRPLGGSDAPIIEKIHEKTQKNGGTWHALMAAIIESDLVQMTRTEADR